MHYNCKIEIEKINAQYVAHVEVSGPGRAGNRRISADSFDGILKAVKDVREELLSGVLAYHNASTPSAPATHHSETPVKKPEAQPALQATKPRVAKVGTKKHRKAQKVLNKRAAARVVAVAKSSAAKEPVRSFAAS